MALTDLAARKAAPKEKPYRLTDGNGLALWVHPNGSKYWQLRYRHLGKAKTLSFGVYPAATLAEARERAAQARKLLAGGIDPSEHRKATRTALLESAGNSFQVIGLEWFAKQKPTWAERHWTKVQWMLESNLFPWLGTRPVAEITAPELLGVLRRIEDRGAVETAKRTKQVAGQVFRYAIATGRAERDPSQDLRGALAPTIKKHLAAITDPQAVGPLLRSLDSYQGTPVVRAALQLAPLTFVRPGELRHARWAEIDLERAEWRYLVTKTKSQHIVALSRQAVAILEDLQRVTGRFEFVFPSARSPRRPMSDNAVLAAMRRLGIGKEEMCGHGFRAMARTILDEVLGYRVDWIEHQLAHAVKDANGRAYNRTAHLEGRRQMMQGWADYLDTLKAEKLPENFQSSISTGTTGTREQ